MRRSLHILCMAALILTILTNTATAKDARLTFAPEGQTLHYSMDIQQEIYVQGIEIVISHTGNVEFEWLEKTDDGAAKISLTFTNVEGTMKQGNNLQEQDLGINGVEVWLVVSSRGKIEEIIPQTHLDETKTRLVEDLVENFIAFLPEDKVGEGDSWKKNRTKEGPTPDDPPEVEGEVEFFLDEFKKSDGRETAKIVGEGKAKINVMTPGGLLTGSAKGDEEYVLAIDGGYIIKAKSFMELKGELDNGQKISQVRRFECRLQ